ncbi:MAG TPA: S-methyl-5-thioribose-1-phosphate isomerase [Ktedonobacteraceae bacterium]|jgi:methylthioribose-1-phosphate isomerase|nr:S-methyl-5-thioribose-1-phosphate isomerase [Ktedonobacteraceae bacterium]
MPGESQSQQLRAVWWEENAGGEAVCMIDQSLLPQRVVILRLAHEEQVADAITTLKVRGAPAIGVAAAFGITLSLYHLLRKQGEGVTQSEVRAHLHGVSEMLRCTRPTAVNLAWAIDRMLRRADNAMNENMAPRQLAQLLRDEAQAIADEDFDACMKMGYYGAELIADGDTLLTHCNAGSLATAGWGTALAPIYVAHRSGKKIHVFVDETRPVLQGARLTAWELQQAGIPLTLITDNMAGHFMRTAAIKAVFVGADRIAANGDVANKIGTYSVAVLAKAHSIPFYVLAPRSTIDLTLASGEAIPIEQRNPEEVTSIRGTAIAPAGIHAANPAFDVTPHIYVTAIITEAGIARPPYEASLRQLCSGYHNIDKSAKGRGQIQRAQEWGRLPIPPEHGEP